MKVRLGALLSAAVTFAVFVVLPLLLPSQLPPELMAAVSQIDFDLSGLLNQTATIGVVISILALVKAFVDKTSFISLALSMVSNVIWLVFSFLILGLGQIGTFGLTEFSFEIEGARNTMAIDMSLFAYLALITVGLNIVHSVLEFQEARSTTKASA